MQTYFLESICFMQADLYLDQVLKAVNQVGKRRFEFLMCEAEKKIYNPFFPTLTKLPAV